MLRKRHLILCFGLTIFIAVLDIVTKNYFSIVCKGGVISIIDDFLCLTFVKNYGAAFGLMKNCRWFFVCFSLISITFILFLFLFYKSKSLLFEISCLFLIGGALGNLIDRISKGYVVDFIYFKFIDFPVFNVSDIFITLGSALLFVYFLKFSKS